MVFGTFDVLHLGHLNFFKQARKLGDELIVVVARDANVLKIKGRAPYFDEKERLALLRELHLVDKVLLGDSQDLFSAIKKLKPTVIALGYDQATMQKQFIIDKLKELSIECKVVRLRAFKEHKHKATRLKKFYNVFN